MRSQIPLDLGIPEPDPPEVWREIAHAVMSELIATGKVFDAWTLTEHGVPDPRHPGQWGGLFRRYANRGLIEPLGFWSSRRASRRSGACQLWRGTRAGRAAVAGRDAA